MAELTLLPAGIAKARASGEGVHPPGVPPQDPAQGAGEEDALQGSEHEWLVTPNPPVALGSCCGGCSSPASHPTGQGALVHWVPRSQVVSRGAGSLHVLTPCLWLHLTRAYKKIEEDDLKFPLIFGEGKKVKCCGRILAGVVCCLLSLFWGISAHFW